MVLEFQRVFMRRLSATRRKRRVRMVAQRKSSPGSGSVILMSYLGCSIFIRLSSLQLLLEL